MLRVSAKAAAAVRRGHPWVWREDTTRYSAGGLVIVHGPHGVVGWGLSDEGPIAVRILGRGEPPDSWSGEIKDRIRRADEIRRRLIAPDTDAYRLCCGAGDGLPGVVIDRYGSLAVFRLYAKAWEGHLNLLRDAVSGLGWADAGWRRLGVERVDGRQGGEGIWGPIPPECVVVREEGIRFLVRPHVGQKTGMFLDQRVHRSFVGRWAAGRLVTNLFAYTGGFSVAAALGGAARVITVDSAEGAIADARENFVLNGLDPDEHVFEVADAFSWPHRMPCDLLILDPPSLARGKRSESAARRAYAKLHRHHGSSVARGGLMATSSCTSRMTMERWRDAVADGLADTGDWSWHWLSAEPPDHPVSLAHREARYLKFAMLRRR